MSESDENSSEKIPGLRRVTREDSLSRFTGSEIWIADLDPSAVTALPYSVEVPKTWPEQRLRQFAGVRLLAACAIRRCSPAHQTVILRGAEGQPVWPEKVRGALAHSGNSLIAGALLSREDTWLGVDVERNVSLSEDVRDIVLRPAERRLVEQLEVVDAAVDALIFCWKECLHKALSPQGFPMLEFAEVRISGLTNRGGHFYAGVDACSQLAQAYLTPFSVSAIAHVREEKIYAALLLRRG